jgi:hypothetical protein
VWKTPLVAFKRAGAIHMARLSCAVLLADARAAIGWTGRMIDGDWFRFPLDGSAGRAATWTGGQGVLAVVASGYLAVLESHEPGSYLPADLDRASKRRGPFSGEMILAVGPGTYAVSHELLDVGERVRIAPK